MVVRLLVVILAFVGGERAASACCVGCPCTKYDRQDPKVVVMQATGYSRSVRGAVPSFSVARITAFLTTGSWQPTPEPLPLASPPGPNGGGTEYHAAEVIRFTTAAKAGAASRVPGRPILVRRIEKQGKAILVEVNGRVFKLAACPKRASYACLVDPGALTLQNIAPGVE